MRNLKLGQPTTRPIAEAIERLRDLMYREYGPKFVLHVSASGAVLATHRPGPPSDPNVIIEACIRE